ncbi:MAG: class I SAM-dependent methyltransferase [Nitrospiraceae bacterium]|nr:MAG: class I SAM-dependent methyltransferase [Nitrospiraceae bacterium]
MERIPEPDLMDDAEQAKAYSEADFSEPHEAFVQHFKSRFPDFLTGEVLDLGCGTADVIIRFARSFPEARITGIDGAQAMLDIGIADVKRKGFEHQINLRKCMLPDKNISDRKYDAVISNSLLHHLPDPFVLWQTVRQCARPGVPVFIMDLLRPDTVKSAGDMVQKYAADASPVLRKDFFNSLLAAYSVQEIQQQLEDSGLTNLIIDVASDRHVLIWGEHRE